MRTIRALLWLGIVAVLIAMAARPAAAESLKVGLILPYSGPFARLGETMDNAVKLWVAQNPAAAAGIEIIRRDETGPNPDTVKRLAQELIQRDHVQVITGLVFTPNALAVAPLATEAKVPVVIMNAATSSITRMSPYFVRVSQTVPQDVAPLGPGLWRTASSGSTQSSATMPPATTPKRISSKRSRKLAGRVSAAPARRSRRPTSRPIWSACWRPSPMRSTCSSRPARRRSPSSGPMLSVG
jgi:branched-chain amino acid transport system substrate-binding protein